MEVGPAFPSGPESFIGVQPGEAALHHPAVLAQPGAVGDASAGDARDDPAGAQEPPILVVVIATVGQQFPGFAPGSATKSADRRDGVHQGQQLGDVVAVPSGEADLQRDAVCLDDQMVLGAGPGPSDGAGPDMVPPLRARTCEPSTAHRSRSSAPTARNSANSISCTAGHTPASVQSLMRRQHLTPETPNRFWGSWFQPSPVLSTNTIPARAARVLVAPRWACWQQRLDSLPQRVRYEIPHHAHQGRRGPRQRSRATPNSF